jgi:hypothetical protein
MMMEMPAPEQEAVVEAPQAAENTQRTGFSFFTQMLFPAPQAQVRQPLVGVRGVETFRVHGVTLSTGNLVQVYLLRALFLTKLLIRLLLNLILVFWMTSISFKH